jgi:RNA polymerase sigma-70 factor (ECF subfamily)
VSKTVESFLSGEEHAAAELVDLYGGRVFGLARAILGGAGEAEDVTQETFLRAWKYRETFDPSRGSFEVWILKIARNLAVNRTKAPVPEPVDFTETAVVRLDPAGLTPSDAVEDALGIRKALAQLPEEQRRAVIYAAVYGDSAKEIGQAEDIPLGTAKTRIRLGLIKLRRILAAALLAAVFAAGWAGNELAHHRQLHLTREYVAALQKLGGRSLRAARLVSADGRDAGQAFLYDGHPSWIFVSVADPSTSGTYSLTLLTNSGKRAGEGQISVTGGAGSIGKTLRFDTATITTVELIDKSGSARYEAQFDK